MTDTGLSIQERLEGLSTYLDLRARHVAKHGDYVTGTELGVWSTAVDDAEDRIEKLEAQNKELLEALELVKLIPRPWMAGASITWPEWDSALETIDAAIARVRGPA